MKKLLNTLYVTSENSYLGLDGENVVVYDDKNEIVYKSFLALATYLKEQGVTGIIYPCTRTNKVVGKNLVLFNKNDAEPIESTIREFNY